MIIHTAFFGGDSWRKLAHVFKLSVQANCPGATLDMVEITHPPPIANCAQHVAWNTHKLHCWNECVQAAEEPVVLMDADMLVLGDLEYAFDPIIQALPVLELNGFDVPPPFDIAYTVRPGPNLINAGVVFVRPTEAGKRFVADWSVLNDEFVAKGPECVSDMVDAYGGINQAALTLTIKRAEGVVLHELECAVWNATRQVWLEAIRGLAGEDGSERPVVIHINTKLRRACFTGRVDGTGDYAYLGPLVGEWLNYARG